MYSEKRSRLIIVGLPGSGKTTLARELESMSGAGIKHFEASEHVIRPLMAWDHQPQSLAEVVNYLCGSAPHSNDRLRFHPTRSSMRQRVHTCQRILGTTWISDCVVKLTEPSIRKKTLVVSGIRGRDNVLSLKKKGFGVVLLNPPKRFLLNRLRHQRGATSEEARDEIGLETQLYRTDGLADIADLTLDTSRFSVSEGASQIYQHFFA